MEPISDEDIEVFCKNCVFLNVKKTGTMREEFTSPPTSIVEEIKSNPESDALYYFLLRSADRFHRLHNRFPGSVDDCYSSDLVAFDALFKTFLKEQKIYVEAPKELEEMVRAGGCQLPAIGAFMGGVASQEIIKIITHQYVPMTNSIIYNGISSTTMVFNSN
jgi:amyloid beta precursor protein binding protein 1